jgi:uncharacterized SAM-binding protein YcdF (DUF218 family)
MRKWLKIALALLALWAGGLGWFIVHLPQTEKGSAEVTATDGIVVLTGGPGRIERGLKLLELKRARRLLISGAHPDTTAKQIATLTKKPDRLFDCCVDIGYDAGNTIGNAREAALWVGDNKFTSVRIVTSRYHLARSLLEFDASLPNYIIIGDAVTDSSSKTELVREYNKYLFRLMWLRLVAPLHKMATGV